eukprot:4360162-Karenia_brevis.AAC.1
MGHAVFRSWCGICVRSRSKEWDHRQDPGDECGYKWTVFVGKYRKTGMIMATTVPQKGGRG